MTTNNINDFYQDFINQAKIIIEDQLQKYSKVTQLYIAEKVQTTPGFERYKNTSKSNLTRVLRQAYDAGIFPEIVAKRAIGFIRKNSSSEEKYIVDNNSIFNKNRLNIKDYNEFIQEAHEQLKQIVPSPLGFVIPITKLVDKLLILPVVKNTKLAIISKRNLIRVISQAYRKNLFPGFTLVTGVGFKKELSGNLKISDQMNKSIKIKLYDKSKSESESKEKENSSDKTNSLPSKVVEFLAKLDLDASIVTSINISVKEDSIEIFTQQPFSKFLENKLIEKTNFNKQKFSKIEIKKKVKPKRIFKPLDPNVDLKKDKWWLTKETN